MEPGNLKALEKYSYLVSVLFEIFLPEVNFVLCNICGPLNYCEFSHR